MPKLLSYKEAKQIASKMTDAYGLPPVSIDHYEGYNPAGVEIYIYRKAKAHFRWFKWIKYTKSKLIRSFLARDLEEGLIRLQDELKRCFASQAKDAEMLREQYAQEEATQALDSLLKK
jgi:hypothetical protein